MFYYLPVRRRVEVSFVHIELIPWSKVLPGMVIVNLLGKKITRLLWNPRIQYRVYKSPSGITILSQINPAFKVIYLEFVQNSNLCTKP